MTTIALIAARGNSKRVPRKNLRKLGGKPLICWSIQAALDSEVEGIYVSSENKEILTVADNYSSIGAVGILERPPELSMDIVQTDEVYLFALRQLQYNFGVELANLSLIMLAPTSPFRNAGHINSALNLHYETGRATIVSAYRESGFHWSEQAEPIYHDPTQRLGLQWIGDEEMLRKENGALYVVDAQRFSNFRSYRIPPYKLYDMIEQDSIDVDTEDDWERAELRAKEILAARGA